MKSPIVSAILLAQGNAAIPWSTVKTTQSNGEEITLRIQVSGASSPRLGYFAKPNGSIDPTLYPLCFYACWGSKQDCPGGWHPFNQARGNQERCWTCCKGGSGDDDL